MNDSFLIFEKSAVDIPVGTHGETRTDNDFKSERLYNVYSKMSFRCLGLGSPYLYVHIYIYTYMYLYSYMYIVNII